MMDFKFKCSVLIYSIAINTILAPVNLVLAANDPPSDVLIPAQSGALPWVVGIGIFVGAIIVGFTSSGRTHLD